MSKKPMILYEKYVALNKVVAYPDARFKSGYRKKETVATAQAMLPDDVSGTALTIDHIMRIGSKFTRTQSYANVSFDLKTEEVRL